MIDDGARVGVAEANARPGQRRCIGGPRLVNTVIAKLRKFPNPPANVFAVRIEPFALQIEVEHPETKHLIASGFSGPSPDVNSDNQPCASASRLRRSIVGEAQVIVGSRDGSGGA
jgi:hypothetical protein